jgi:flagellar motor switch protein FliM
MTDQSTLSGEEIAALMGGLREQEARSGAASAIPRSFTFGSDAARPVSALPVLDRMNERMARRLRDVIEPFARVKPKVTAETIQVQTYEEWQAEQPVFSSLSLYSFSPLTGTILLSVEAEYVGRLVDSFYGGAGASGATRQREFTATEESLIGRLSQGVIDALAQVWSEVVPVRPKLRTRETNVAFANPARGDEPVAVSRFTITPARGNPSTLVILYPVASLRSVETELSAKSHQDATAQGGEWRHRLVNGSYAIRASGIFQQDKEAFLDAGERTPGYRDFRGAIDGAVTPSFARPELGRVLVVQILGVVNQQICTPGELDDFGISAFLLFDIRGIDEAPVFIVHTIKHHPV